MSRERSGSTRKIIDEKFRDTSRHHDTEEGEIDEKRRHTWLVFAYGCFLMYRAAIKKHILIIIREIPTMSFSNIFTSF